MNLIPEEKQRELLIYAFRYTLGRATYAPHTIVEILKLRWGMLSDSDKRLFQSEIKEAIEHDNAGHYCDKKAWQSILDFTVGKLK